MNQDKLHDALSLLDDGMIEAVEKLRSRAPKKRVPIHWMSVAACLCIAAVVLFAAGKFVQLLLEMQNEDELISEGYDNAAGTESGVIEENGEVPSLLLKITSWSENGFTGTVAGILNTDIYSVGTELIVLFSDDISYFPREGCTAREGTPSSKDFPAGTTVWVQFSGAPENTPEVGTTETILFAKCIGPASMAAAPADTTEKKG